MLRFLLGVFLVGVAAPAVAADWWYVGDGGSGDSRHIAYVDRASLAKDGKHGVRVWSLAVLASPRESGETHSRTLRRFDCRSKTWALLTTITYDGSEGVLNSDYTESAPMPVAPGTVGESAFNFACGHPSGAEYRVAAPVRHGREAFAALQAKAGTGEQQGRVSQGTGFFVGPGGQVLTAYHVIEGAEEIGIYTGGKMFPARILKISQANDLALLTIERPSPRYLGLAAPGTTDTGDRVFTIGFPAVDLLGSEPKFTEGSVSAVSGMGDESALIQISVPIQPGNSGGPLVNESGRVVGVIGSTAEVGAFVAQTGALPQNVNYAVKVENVLALVSGAKPLPVASRKDAIELTRSAVVGVLARR